MSNLPQNSNNTQNAIAGVPPSAPPPQPPQQIPAFPSNSPAGSTPPRHSLDPNIPLPPPPTEAIPLGLGPDGKSLMPKLGPDGKPLKGPPLGEDGKPLPPPPIIGPDGKEIPRPKDDKGRPLPIYVSPEGKPVLDKDGNPIPLRFNKEGKPIPLEIEYPSEEPPSRETGGGMGPPPPPNGVVSGQTEKIPDSVFYIGIGDIVVSLIVAAVVTFFMIGPYNSSAPIWPFLAGSVAVSIIGAICGSLPMIASQKNDKSFMWLWCGASAFLMLIQLGVLFGNPQIPIDLGRSIAAAFCGIRLVFTLCVNFIFLSSSSSDQAQQGQQALYYQQQYSAALQNSYPRENTGYYHYQEQQMTTPSMMVAPQQSTMTVVHQPVVVQQPIMSYGYAYPAIGGYYGGYGGYNYGMGLGLGLGLGLGGYGGWGCHGYCPYYDYGWGWGSDCWW